MPSIHFRDCEIPILGIALAAIEALASNPETCLIIAKISVRRKSTNVRLALSVAAAAVFVEEYLEVITRDPTAQEVAKKLDADCNR